MTAVKTFLSVLASAGVISALPTVSHGAPIMANPTDEGGVTGDMCVDRAITGNLQECLECVASECFRSYPGLNEIEIAANLACYTSGAAVCTSMLGVVACAAGAKVIVDAVSGVPTQVVVAGTLAVAGAGLIAAGTYGIIGSPAAGPGAPVLAVVGGAAALAGAFLVWVDGSGSAPQMYATPCTGPLCPGLASCSAP